MSRHLEEAAPIFLRHVQNSRTQRQNCRPTIPNAGTVTAHSTRVYGDSCGRIWCTVTVTPRGRVTAGDGGGHDDAEMRRAQKHMNRRGRRSK